MTETSSAFVVHQVLYKGRVLVPRLPLHFEVSAVPLDPEEEAAGVEPMVIYVAVNRDVPLEVLCLAQAEAPGCVNDEINFLWDCYARAEDRTLDPGALELAEKLRRWFEER